MTSYDYTVDCDSTELTGPYRPRPHNCHVYIFTALHRMPARSYEKAVCPSVDVLLLITNRKSHTVFRSVPTSVTLNGVIALILLYFTEFDSLAGLLRHSG